MITLSVIIYRILIIYVKTGNWRHMTGKNGPVVKSIHMSYSRNMQVTATDDDDNNDMVLLYAALGSEKGLIK